MFVFANCDMPFCTGLENFEAITAWDVQLLNTTKALPVLLNSIRSKPDSSVKCLECVSKMKIRKFEWILRQFKEETRRLSSAKSRVDDAEMAQKTPKLRIREFLRHTLLECVSNGTIRRFEWILRQFKEEIRRLNSAKSSLVTQKRRSDARNCVLRNFWDTL